MKKLLVALLSISLFLTACSNAEETNESNKEPKNAESKEGTFEVDKGLLNVEITLPASFFEGQDINQVIAEAKEDGISDVTKNEDGSVTYKMSKSEHKELMTELENSLIESFEQIKNGTDFPSIKDVKYNKTFSEFTLIVDKEAYENSFDAFATMGLGLTGAYYQIFNGKDPNNYQVKITVIDEVSGENLGEVVYPDDFEGLEEETQESVE